MSVHQGISALRVAVLGAGPIGLEAALYGARLGHQVLLIERGGIGEAVQSWGHVRMFSPLHMNVSPLGRALLAAQGRPPLADASCLTGGEYVGAYLLPLSQDPLLAGRLRLHTRAVAIGKSGLRKGDLIGQAARGERPFRLLTEDAHGEHVLTADVVLDCTGTYGSPSAIGAGGIAAPGERWLGERLIRHLPDVRGKHRARFARRRVLLVGAGLSAATTMVELAALCAEEPRTRVVWSVRRDLALPYTPIADDALPARAALHAGANRIAEQGRAGEGPIHYRPGTSVDCISAEGHQLRVRLVRSEPRPDGISVGVSVGVSVGASADSAPPADADAATALGESAGASESSPAELFDEVIGLTGYGPERDLYRELQVHECYASLGPMRLAAALLGASGDCLAQPSLGPEVLKNPEPRFFILGAKSYGRNSAFLLQHGLEQVRGAYALLHGDPSLDLYGG